MTTAHHFSRTSRTRACRLTASPRLIALGIMLILTLATTLVGCTLGSRDEDPVAPPSPATTSSPLDTGASAEPVEPQPAEAAQAAQAGEAAERVYRSYIRARNAIDFRDLTSWRHLELMSENLQVTDSAFLTLAQAHELTMTGEIVIERFDVLSTRSDGSVSATACLDVSTVAFQDSTGTTMPLGYAPETQQFELRFVEEHGALVLDAEVVTTDDRC